MTSVIIFGTRQYRKLCGILEIPGVGIKAIKFWFLPIYKVEIIYTGKK